MNLQPHQKQFAHAYAGPAYPQHQQQNFQGPEPCYNCGSPQHVAQHCREARRAVPAGSLTQAPRPHRSSKKNNKPIVTRFAPPPNHANNNYPQPPFPQAGPYQPPNHPQQQQPSQHWQKQPLQSYATVQSWQQPYAASPVTPSPQATAYGTHQQAPHYGYGQPGQPAYPPQQPYGSYVLQGGYQAQAQSQPAHPQYNQAPQLHPQTSYTQQQNYQQYPQQQPIQSPYTPITPQAFPQAPPTQSYHGQQPQQFPQASVASSVPTPQQQPLPPKPPPCFPNAEKNANPTAKSGVIIWRPAQPTETPLEATFNETDDRRNSKKATPVNGVSKGDGKKKCFSKYFDAKGNRLNRDIYQPDSEIMQDPAFKSVRTGESMLAQPLDFVLPDDPEEDGEPSNGVTGENLVTNRDGLEDGLKVDEAAAQLIGVDEAGGGTGGTNVGDLLTDSKIDKVSGKMQGVTELRNNQASILPENKKSWNRQPISIQTSHNGYVGRREGVNGLFGNNNNNGARGRSNGINQGKRKSRSPLDNGRPQKHRVRDPHSAGSNTHIPSQPPAHHPLPPKPVTAPPPLQHLHQGRPPNANRRNHKQRTHPYARRSASPVRHFLVDPQRREREYNRPQGGNRRQQQQVSNSG